MPLLEGSSDEIIQKNIEMLIAEGRTPKQAAAIAYAKAGRTPKANAQELTFEYLKAFYDHVMEHPAIFKELTDEIHIKSRAKAGGQLHVKKDETETMPKLNLHFNNAEFGGKVLYKDDQITVVPTAIMQERVTNGAMKLYDEFKDSVHWWRNKPIIPPHAQGDPPVSHRTKIAGKVLDAWLNPELKRIDGVAMFYNARIAPDDLKRIWEGEMFGNSPGYYCNDEALPGSWEGTDFQTTERGPYYPDHLSMVPRGACPLPHCGFSVDVPVDEARIARLLDGIKLNFEVQRMTEEIKPAEVKTNAEIKPVETPIIEAPKVNVENHIDLSAVLTKMDALSSQVAEIKVNMAAKDSEIATLKAAEEVRINAQHATEDKLIADTVERMLLPAFKSEKDAHIAAFKANSALWIAQNTDKIDFAAYAKSVKIEPTGAAFVPHVNTLDDDEFASVGVPSVEDLGKLVRGG